MDLDRHILAVVEPAIMPTDIELESVGEEDDAYRQSKSFAIASPYVTINGYSFARKDVDSFTLNLSGQVPELKISIIDSRNNFSIDSFPRDGDVITFLLNSKNESTFKSIHMDFDITSVNSIEDDSNNTEYTFTGKAKIPLLDTEECRHFEVGTSLEHLEEEAKYLGLGLATNIDAAGDPQIRIQAYSTHAKFINEIVTSSYVSEESFQTSFIDQYYYLNFVDINRVFNSKNMSLNDMEDTVMSSTFSLAEDSDRPVENDNIKAKVLLTNHFDLKQNNNFISSWTLENNSSAVVAAHGHFRDVQIYDNNGTDTKLQEFRLDPLTSNSMLDSEEPLRGRRDEDRYLNQLKHKYSGRQDVGEDGLGNVHQNHVYCKLHNMRNIVESSKMVLKVTLQSFNPSIYKYQKVPVIIYHYDEVKVKSELDKNEKASDMGFEDQSFEFNNDEGGETPKMTLDTFMSGNYVISNINYRYDEDGLMQDVTLLRREWPVSMGNL